MTTETSESEEAVIIALTMPTVRATVILATPLGRQSALSAVREGL